MKKTIAFINPRLSTQNVGDYFIEDSLKKILDFDSDSSIDIDPRKPISSLMINRINECQAAVIVGTNLWYRDIFKEGRWMFSADQLKRIKIPIIPIGVGTTRHAGENDEFSSESIEILKIIHSSCELGSVRDLRTLEALQKAGIHNLVMTCCPTLFRSLKPGWELNNEIITRKIVVTVRKGQKKNVRVLIKKLKQKQWQPIIAAQQPKDTYFKKWIPFIQKPAHTLYEFNCDSYLKLVKECYGSIGWRLHGNMLHLSLGNPAVFFANCSRAQSFCEALHLPWVYAEDHTRISESQIEAAIERINDPETFKEFPIQYQHYYKQMKYFLEANQLGNSLNNN